MRRYHVHDLGATGTEHIASSLVRGRRVSLGGVAIHSPGQRNHAPGEHRHEDEEILCFVAGRGVVHTADGPIAVTAGDVLAVDPWEEHDIEASTEAPTISCWFHVSEPADVEPALSAAL